VFLDPMYFVFALPPMLLVLWAQAKVKGAYGKYSKVRNMSGLPGHEVARVLLQNAGVYDVSVERVRGELTDHYDPRTRTLRLSDSVYASNSVAATGIAAHEVGHAIQHSTGYAWLHARSALVPVVNLGSTLGYLLFFGGIVIGMSGLVWVGIAAFSMGLLFALVTLPVEFNASGRAIAMLKGNGLVGVQDQQGVSSVLQAAALTYIAAVAQALGTLLYFVWIAMGRRN
jgi:uncharacterized protein